MTDNDKIPYLPERIHGLADLALNLWWRWGRRARLVFRRVDPPLWSATRHNPVELLRRVAPGRLAELAQDPEFLELYDFVMAEFAHATGDAPGWFEQNYPDVDMSRPVAYFCAEFGLHNSIPIYSGGLGVLAGDHCKSASDLKVPFVGVGLLYSKGYFDQKLNLEGWQESSDEVFDHRIMPLVRLSGPDDSYCLAVVETAGRKIYIGAWQLDAGGVRLYLLDTDLPENHPEDRELTYKLYGGGDAYRLRQEWILGVGGVRVLRALGVQPGAWHANEGHAAFMMVERLREQLNAGVEWDDAVRAVRARSVFTTHTPVPAGHDTFSPELVSEVCGNYHESMGIDEETFHDLGHHPVLDHGRFHMTVAAMRLSAHVNGVSKLHGRVTQDIWTPLWPGREPTKVPIGYVTNGVHLGSWMSNRYLDMLLELFGPGWDRRILDEVDWDRVFEIPDRDIWEAHLQLKQELFDFCREQARRRWTELWKEPAHLIGSGSLLAPKALTIGFARRFATYKRGALLFRDIDRLQRLLTDLHRPVQLIFAGKAHPADHHGKAVLQQVWRSTRDSRFQGRIAFVEDYDLHVAHRLVQGVDVWLNLPRVPFEASGTSGMKAALNCVPHFSTIDGWWAEGYNGENGWALPLVEGSDDEVDARDYQSLMEILEQKIVPEYYEVDDEGIPRAWVRRMKEAMVVAGRKFTTSRMVRDYATQYYAAALRGHVERDDPPTDRSAARRGEVLDVVAEV